MRIRRLLTVAALAAVVAALPVSSDPGASTGLKLSTASCSEGSCGLISRMDCICPDLQMPNTVPLCDEPPSP